MKAIHSILLLLILISGHVHMFATQSDVMVELMGRYCIDCHDSVEAKGEVDLEAALFEPEYQLEQNGHLLKLIHRTLREEEMPPPQKKRQPSKEERQILVKEVARMYQTLADSQKDDPGHVVMQRLTKEEYRNVLRDLTGGIVTNAGVYIPNEGGAGEGFNNVGEAQSMGTAQLEKYLEAARLTLRHLRATPAGGWVWNPIPMEPVDDPDDARLDAVNTIIEWFADEQYKYAFEMGDLWEKRYGTAHGPFLEAAWKFQHRKDDKTSLADISMEYEPPLPIVPLEKWWKLLSEPNPKSPWVGWTRRWQALPEPLKLGNVSLQKRSQDIVNGVRDEKFELKEDFAPDYEVSFNSEVLESARKEHRWDFRIEIGKAKELFLVCTQGGDDNRGDFGIWHSGNFEFADGTKKPWHQVTKIRGANSGRIYSWAKYNDGTGPLRADGHGVRPPGALKIEVPEGAKFLNVTFEVDRQRTERASLQVLILMEKPPVKLQSFYPGRLVFGGKTTAGKVDKDSEARDRNRALQRINIPGANRTKAGLNAELNVMATWDRTPMEYIGGPWEHQEADAQRPDAPYHMTAQQVLRNATNESLNELEALFDRLESISQVEQQQLHQWALKAGWEASKEGVNPTSNIKLDSAASKLLKQIRQKETQVIKAALQQIDSFAQRAWRRNLSPKEQAQLKMLFTEARTSGLSYDSSIKQSLLAVLVSPHFLYRLPISKTPPKGIRALTDFEIANRLSFFLWGSIPDDQLLNEATSGNLTKPKVLRQQVSRMLQDGRAKSLAIDFGGQMFGFTGFEEYNVPDPERFPEFTPQIRAAMLEEVIEFLDHIIREGAPVTDLLAAEYSFLNGTLARHYGIKLNGNHFQKVKLPANRGGLASMGLFLTKTSEPLRTSPVVRGTWVYESLLGHELPSPPANIPAISQDETDDKGRSIREQLEFHRADAGCASCHNKIDPLGVALEQFDPIGRWRTELRDGSKPDVKATTKDGVDLNGAQSLKQYLASQEHRLIEYLTQKLLGYALGRSTQPGDKALLDRLNNNLTKQENQFQWLVEEIVLSPQFRNRRD